MARTSASAYGYAAWTCAAWARTAWACATCAACAPLLSSRRQRRRRDRRARSGARGRQPSQRVALCDAEKLMIAAELSPTAPATHQREPVPGTNAAALHAGVVHSLKGERQRSVRPQGCGPALRRMDPKPLQVTLDADAAPMAHGTSPKPRMGVHALASRPEGSHATRELHARPEVCCTTKAFRRLGSSLGGRRKGSGGIGAFAADDLCLARRAAPQPPEGLGTHPYRSALEEIRHCEAIGAVISPRRNPRQQPEPAATIVQRGRADPARGGG